MIQIPEIHFQEFWQVFITSKLLLFFLGIHYNNINSSGFFCTCLILISKSVGIPLALNRTKLNINYKVIDENLKSIFIEKIVHFNLLTNNTFQGLKQYMTQKSLRII